METWWSSRNEGKARTIRRLHESGFHVLADKPWLAEPADLEHLRASFEGWPLAAEIMTGRHDVAAGLVKRLVGAAALFGAFRDDEPAIEHESVHHLEKLVDGVTLRRPWWYFDVRVQGSGPVDIPTHVVDQASGSWTGTPRRRCSSRPAPGRRECPRRRSGGSPERRGSRGSSSRSSTAGTDRAVGPHE